MEKKQISDKFTLCRYVPQKTCFEIAGGKSSHATGAVFWYAKRRPLQPRRRRGAIRRAVSGIRMGVFLISFGHDGL
ncbi:hypothetical protein AAKU55_002459 [Oxalobacteraceae bacterium GrIS 1.11]